MWPLEDVLSDESTLRSLKKSFGSNLNFSAKFYEYGKSTSLLFLFFGARTPDWRSDSHALNDTKIFPRSKNNVPEVIISKKKRKIQLMEKKSRDWTYQVILFEWGGYHLTFIYYFRKYSLFSGLLPVFRVFPVTGHDRDLPQATIWTFSHNLQKSLGF